MAQKQKFKPPTLGVMGKEMFQQPVGPYTAGPPPAPQQDPRVEAARRLREQADQLEAEMAPKQAPQGIGHMLLRALGEGVLSSQHPQGFHGYQADRAATERQRQQDLLLRAKGLRGEALQQEQLGMDEQQLAVARRRAEMEATQTDLQRRNILSQIQERERLARMPIEVTGGASLMTPEGQIRGTAPLIKAPTEKNPGYRDAVVNGRTVRRYFDQSDPSTVTYEEDLGPAMPPAIPGAYQPLFNPAGQVESKFDSETGAITPVQNPTGARRTPLPQTAMDRLASFDSTESILSDIKTYSDRIHTDEGITARAGGLIRRGKSYLGYDNDVSLLRSKAGELSQIIRAMGEVGALAEGDVARGVALVPIQPELTKTEANGQINDLLALVRKGRANYRRLYGLPPTEGTEAPPPPEPAAPTEVKRTRIKM